MAQAIWGIAKSLTPDKPRAAIVLIAVAVVVFVSESLGQIAAITGGAILGLWLCRSNGAAVADHLSFPVSRRGGAISLAIFAALFVIPPLLASTTGHQAVALFDAFYHSGALVFGGGHVVLPLLQA